MISRTLRFVLGALALLMVLSTVTCAGCFLLIAGGSAELIPSSALAEGDIPAEDIPLYQAAVQKYCPSLPWNVLAAVGKKESDHGRLQLPGVTSGSNSAGAAGWMQMGIGTGAAGNIWATLGRDYDHDGRVSPYAPGDALPAAALYLCRLGADPKVHVGSYSCPEAGASQQTQRIRQALHGYNHACWYVDDVMQIAASYAQNGATESSGPALSGLVTTAKRQQILTYAQAQLGKPYQWGGVGPAVFDCSGLTRAAYSFAGIPLRGNANTQYLITKRIPDNQRQPGDLVFFGSALNKHHVGIFLKTDSKGNSWMLDAPHTGAVVRIEIFQGPGFGGWRDYAGAGRIGN